ncbi:MAG: glycosyltransferase, partial [Leptospira sp.]|nr:glycosyltransferase [Leptospira sp.]
VYEGFGIPLLEAMAHEKYSIVSDIPTFREIGKDRIRYLGLESTRKWAGEIVKFMNKPKKVKFHPEEFTWEESARITKNAFDLLLK